MKKKLYSIELSEEAEIDFDKSHEYYSEDSPKVADAFFKRVNLSLENIKQNPFSYPEVYKEICCEKVSICNLLPNRRLHNKSYCLISYQQESGNLERTD